jgi:hypothetical protein
MAYGRHLGKAVLVGLGSLIVLGALLSAYFAFETWRTPDDLFSPLGAALTVFGCTMIIGFFPVVLFGAPLYAFLLSSGRASWFAAICLGVLPGVLLYFVAWDLATFAAAGGIFVALCTHAACTIRPNYSLKRTNQSLRD